MRRELKTTGDGSSTLYVPELNENYHSVHGAIQESKHVFIQMGIDSLEKKKIHVLEIGLGTGLNALLTKRWAESNKRSVYYQAIEKYPLRKEEINQLNYTSIIENSDHAFREIHQCSWENSMQLSAYFNIQKEAISIREMKPIFAPDVIYFDAFAPEKQPDLWTKEIFSKMFEILTPKGILVTYCAKGVVRRTMENCGFQVERLKGPPGKREMIRAKKVDK